MKATGIIRRIDELGRVVIPKDIRRSFNLAYDGRVEVYIDSESIILKKHSSLGKISDIAYALTKALHDVLTKEIIIIDNEKVISTSKSKTINSSLLTNQIIKLLRKKEMVEAKDSKINITDNYSITGDYIICPLIKYGTVCGAIIVIGTNITDNDIKTCKMFLHFIELFLDE